MKILLLEDDTMLNDAITEYLSVLGHQVRSFTDGNAALACVCQEPFDLLVLDINVPHLDGLELLEALHAQKIRIPAIFISALIDIEDISRAYDLGCYDYLKKPFHLKELMLRIDKVMLQHRLPQQHLRLSSCYSFDVESSTLFCDHVPQVLSKKQMQIIALLAANKGRVVDFDLFRLRVWDEAWVDNATIRAELSRLKKMLKEDFIQNIRGVGYRIDA